MYMILYDIAIGLESIRMRVNFSYSAVQWMESNSAESIYSAVNYHVSILVNENQNI